MDTGFGSRSPRPYVEDGDGFLPVTSGSGRLVAWARVDADALPRLSARPWRLTTRGYVARCERRRGSRVTVLLAREVLGVVDGGPRVLHRNGDKLDNRAENLKWSTSWLARRLDSDGQMAGALLRLAREDAVHAA